MTCTICGRAPGDHDNEPHAYESADPVLTIQEQALAKAVADLNERMIEAVDLVRETLNVCARTSSLGKTLVLRGGLVDKANQLTDKLHALRSRFGA